VLGVAVKQAAVIAVWNNQNLRSGDGRTTAFHYALAAFHNDPLFGYGPTLFSPKYRAQFVDQSIGWLGQAHNQLFQTLAEGGLFGTILLVAFVCVLLQRGLRRQIELAGIAMPLVALLLVTGTASSVLRNRAPDVIFLLVVIVVAVLLADGQSLKPRERSAEDQAQTAPRQSRPPTRPTPPALVGPLLRMSGRRRSVAAPGGSAAGGGGFPGSRRGS
jgi:O-antigen ligase